MPTLCESEITWVIQQVAEYIDRQRQTHRDSAVPLNASQRAAMQGFFPASTLDAVRVTVLTGERVGNPPFYDQLVRIGFQPAALPNFALMAAITFVDTVVSHEPFTDRLLFHELVHVVQYEKLGLEGFAIKYLRGFLNGGSYEAIPLEMNAYELTHGLPAHRRRHSRFRMKFKRGSGQTSFSMSALKNAQNGF